MSVCTEEDLPRKHCIRKICVGLYITQENKSQTRETLVDLRLNVAVIRSDEFLVK